eukprot:TRINITY_DN54561_c0_g1_i1.p1 TRINITY_DN54561_c0_g1~~TRINITY_DN54561_c0_g1_i1.p1  ORF type:complete len:701 (-),score=156.40 TRINITY_DN54561_c0_g1_i1:176-2278(-)
MTSWLKAAAQVADSVQKHAEKIQDSAFQMVEGAGLISADYHDVTFDSGALGFGIEGLTVSSVDRGGQAERFGVQVGDVISAVDGFQVPKIEDGTDPKTVARTVGKWIKEMPRPGTVTFCIAARHGNGADGAGSANDAKPVRVGDVGGGRSRAHAVPSRDSGDGGGGRSASSICGSLAGPETTLVESETTLAASSAEPSDAEAERVMALLAATTDRDLGDVVSAAASVTAISQPAMAVSSTTVDASIGLAGDPASLGDEKLSKRNVAMAAGFPSLADAVMIPTDDCVGTAHSSMEARVRSLQDQLSTSRSEHEVAKRTIAELQTRLGVATAQCEELRQEASRGEEEIREAFESRERLLEDEVTRLMGTLSTVEVDSQRLVLEAERNAAAAQTSVEELKAEVLRRADAERRLSARSLAAEESAAFAGQELRRLSASHTAELEQAQLRHEQIEQQLRRQCAELERVAAEKRKLANDAENERHFNAKAGQKGAVGADEGAASDASDEADVQTSSTALTSDFVNLDGSDSDQQKGVSEESANPLGSKSDIATDAGIETSESSELAEARQAVMHDRIEMLETRCILLQKKLNARPIVYAAKSGPGQASTDRTPPTWEPLLRSVVGDRIGDVVALAHHKIEKTLRSFTDKLLKRRSLLWIFYMHLVVLYTIAATWLAQATPSNAADVMDATLREVSQTSAATLRGGK